METDLMPTDAVIVTGATGGIGSALVEALFREGGHIVIGACRTPARLDSLRKRLQETYPDAGSELRGVRLDLSTVASTLSCAETIKDMIVSEGLRLRAVINNAGVMPVSRLETSPDGMEMTLQVNCISTLAFTTELLPLLDSGSSVVMTSSVMRRLPALDIDFDTKALKADNFVKRFNNYGRSKRLLTHAARYLADRVASRGIRVNCADPGVVDSGIIRLGYPIVDRLADLIARPLMSTPAKGARAALKAVACERTAMMHTAASSKELGTLTPDETQAVEKALKLAGVRAL